MPVFASSHAISASAFNPTCVMAKVWTVPSSAVTVSTPERRYSVLGVAMISMPFIEVVVTAPVHVSLNGSSTTVSLTVAHVTSPWARHV